MSGTGKSHWSQKLVHFGFRHLCCDDLIEEKLGHILKRQGYRGIHDVARWMGQPYEPRYPKTSHEYVKVEIDVMTELLSKLEQASVKDNIILDTTGSVIYVPSVVISKLKRYTTLVYLETPSSVREQMLQRYIKDPKPVIWGEAFSQRAGESHKDAIIRCYPKLLRYRSQKYEAMSDLVVQHKIHANELFTPHDLIELIHDYQQSNTCFY